MKRPPRTSRLATSSRSQPVPAITDAEWIVMKAVWDLKSATANEVVAALTPKTDWKPKTIHTLLRRLVAKHALSHETSGREFVYHPLVDEAHCTHAATRSFLERFFEGHLAPFVACFLEQENLSRAEVEELRRILNQRRR